MWTNSFYRPSALLSNYTEIDTILSILTPIIVQHDIDITYDAFLLSKSNAVDLSRYVFTPAFPHRTFEEMVKVDPTKEENRTRIIQTLSSSFVISYKQVGSQNTIQMSKTVFKIYDEISDQKINVEDWPEFVNACKEAVSMHSLTHVFGVAFSKRKAHIWFAYIALSRKIMSKYYFDDSLFLDFYKVKKLFSILEHIMKKL